MKKAQLDISFPWLFALIVGAFIIFLAIYAAVKLINTEETSTSAQTSKEIGVILNPLETGFESAKSVSLEFPIETRIYNGCNNDGNFGRQLIQTAQMSFGKWADSDIQVGFSNRYIFSEQMIEGKNFFAFSKPFEFPFKIADLIYITPKTEKYCFKNAPDNIVKEIQDLNQENMVATCKEDFEGKKICFQASGKCDVQVNIGQGSVSKQGKIVYYKGDALMYAAVFSDPEIYECQLKRLMQRVYVLALIYNQKESFVSIRNCDAELNLEVLANAANSYKNSANLYSIWNTAEEIGDKNDKANCKLW